MNTDQPTTAEPIYNILESRFADLEKKVARFANKARQQGFPAITLENLGEKAVEETDTDPQTGKLVATGRHLIYIQVKIHGQAPVINGHTFVARLEHTPAGNIISKAPGMEGLEVPAKVRDRGSFCDHCSTNRDRNDTFLLLVEGTKELKQVGRNCLADFVRDADAAAALSIWSLLHEVREASEATSGSGEGYWNTLKYVSHCFRMVELFGWHSRGGAYDGGPDPTASVAFFGMTPCLDVNQKERWQKQQPTAVNKKDAEKALAWAQSLSEDNDYKHNLQVACSLNYVRPQNMGIVASLVIAYQRACEQDLEQDRRAAQTKQSEHFGTKGSRYLRALTVTKTKDIHGDYGLTILYTMEDDEGSVFKWFSSNGCSVSSLKDGQVSYTPLESGVKHPFVFQVKDHTEYNKLKQTIISRATPQVEGSKAPKWITPEGEIFKTKKALVSARVGS